MYNGGLIRILYNDEVVKHEIFKFFYFLAIEKKGLRYHLVLYHTILFCFEVLTSNLN